jgi:hypothetical protein
MRSSTSTLTGKPPGQDIGGIRKNIAKALIGRTVDLMDASHSIAHGVVAAVLVEAGRPKLLVNGSRYDLNQVITVTA